MNYQQKETVELLWAIFKYPNYVTILSLQFSSSFATYLLASAKNGGVLAAISLYWMGQQFLTNMYMIVQLKTIRLCIYVEANLHMQYSWRASYKSLDFATPTGFF